MLCCIAVLTGLGAAAPWFARRWRWWSFATRQDMMTVCGRHCIAQRVRRVLVVGVVLLLASKAVSAFLPSNSSAVVWTDFICTSAPVQLKGAPKLAWLD